MVYHAISRLVYRRGVSIPLAGMLVALAGLGLVLLVSAQSPPVSVEKTAAPDAVFAGDFTKYTVVFSNTTAADVNIDVVSDTLPAGFTFLSMGSGSEIKHDPPGATGTIVWDREDPYVVPADSTLTLAYNVRLEPDVQPGVYENRVEARLETGEKTVPAVALVTAVAVDLVGTKTARTDEVRHGDPVEYEVALTNSGNADAVLTAITDTLPAGFTFQQMLSGPLPAPTVQGRDLIWTGPISILAGNQLQFAYSAIASGTGGQVYRNSLRAAYNGMVVGPYEAEVTLLPSFVYLPLIAVRESGEPPPVYRLAFETKPGGNFEIYAINADGTEELNVSRNDGGDADPVWSPDGLKIAWVRFIDGAGDIVVADADGNGEINLTNYAKDDRDPNWSPDGSKIAFWRLVDDDGDLRRQVYTMDANGANPIRLTSHECQSYDPNWSPDGTKIAYVCGLNEYADIYVMDANGSNARFLTDNRLPEDVPAWSPDSTRIAYVRYDGVQRRDSEIYVVDVASGVNTRLTFNDYSDYSPAWSPDGTKIAFSTYLGGSYEVAVMDADGSNVTNVTDTALGDFFPKWSPDGTMLSFISARDGNKELYVMDADGSNQFRLTFTGTDEMDHDWKPQ
jgi:uncharacterized repeat protein (TIGR01451 family)